MNNIEQTREIIEKIENVDMDIKKTIEKATTAGYLGESHFYCTVIDEQFFTHSVPEILGDRTRSMELDNNYFDIISKALDKDGIFISLAYCSPYIAIPPEFVDETVEYDEYDLDLESEDEEDLYMMEYAMITADSQKVFKIYAEEGIAGHGRTEDIGLMVKIIDGEYKTYFAVRTADLCMSSLSVMPLREEYPKEHQLSIKNPINRMLIEMINDTIVLNE